ncbi:AraC family transcriptional regulator [Aliidongia dinghuensis]|uniref:AraC family transcriptional regulator n=1 Tax=Aliidongia dinghuensis TaxID=1867774 RepID=A0A8J3E0S7_9PROT|nr:AraC family transcriptional regulator [Aliidongia dinghuensis]GGF04723.1 AraC family transcriptional regulator [Aliidongia dinghuensis]
MIRHRSPSAEDSCFAQYLSQHYGENQRGFLRTGWEPHSDLTVHRKRSALPVFGQVSAPALEDGFLVSISLRGDSQQLVRNGRFTETRSFPADSLGIRDLSEAYAAYLCSPFDFLFFHVPRAALDRLAEESGARRIDRLFSGPGIVDPIAASLGRALLPALSDPTVAKALFVEHVALALNSHLAQTYGGLQVPAARQIGRLSGPQERRARELLLLHVGKEASITAIAAECGLSRSYFIKAFKQTTGMTPHKWLLDRRIQQAKDLLLRPGTAIAETAVDCGFADQSHLTRVFTSVVGMPPGAWRREHAA